MYICMSVCLGDGESWLKEVMDLEPALALRLLVSSLSRRHQHGHSPWLRGAGCARGRAVLLFCQALVFCGRCSLRSLLPACACCVLVPFPSCGRQMHCRMTAVWLIAYDCVQFGCITGSPVGVCEGLQLGQDEGAVTMSSGDNDWPPSGALAPRPTCRVASEGACALYKSAAALHSLISLTPPPLTPPASFRIRG